MHLLGRRNSKVAHQGMLILISIHHQSLFPIITINKIRLLQAEPAGIKLLPDDSCTAWREGESRKLQAFYLIRYESLKSI
jgi:hypothetical protein